MGRHVKQPLCLLLLNHFLLLSICSFYISCVSSCAVKACDNIGTFQQILDISLPICAEECFRRQRCQIFMFRNGMNYCALKDDINLSLLGEKDPVCLYFTIDDWLPNNIGPCNGHACNVTERCSKIRENEIECQKSECPTPDEIADSKTLSNTHSIGTKNRYKCNNGFIGYGNPTITCGDDGMWSDTDFQCISILSCPVPNQHYFNADLTHVEGSLYTAGTVLTFTCRKGYRQAGDEWKITCQESLLWDNFGCIRCCTEKSTHALDADCHAIIDGGEATSYDEAREFCKSIGGWLDWTTWNMVDLYNKTTTYYVLQARKISSIAKSWNYNACAAANGVQGDSSKSLKDKIDDVVNNNWTGSDCWWGTIWVPGQPNSSPNEDCMVRFLHEPNLRHHDYPCTFNPNDSVGFACNFPEPNI